MLKALKQFFEFSSKNGLYLPNAYDQDKEAPSITLLIVHLANIVALASIIYLAVQDRKAGAISAIVYAVISMVLYLMRRITKFSVDVDDGELSAESGEGVGPGENNEQK